MNKKGEEDGRKVAVECTRRVTKAFELKKLNQSQKRTAVALCVKNYFKALRMMRGI